MSIRVDERARGRPCVGKNLTLEGADWRAAVAGSSLRLGADVILQVTGYTAPCRNIIGSFHDRQVGRRLRPRAPARSGLWSGNRARILSADEIRVLITAR